MFCKYTFFFRYDNAYLKKITLINEAFGDME